MWFLQRNRPSNAELQHCKISKILAQFFIVHNVKFAEMYFCTAWFISLESLHIYSKIYVLSNTIEGFHPKCAFRGCLSKYRLAFIVYMFRWPPEVWSLVSDNALISGTGKVEMLRRGLHHTGGFNLWWLDSTVPCRYNVVNFLTNIHKKAPHSSPARARYGVTFVCSPSDWYSASVPAISCAISYHIGPHYNSTRQVFSITPVVTLTLNQHTVNVHWICTGCCWQYSETTIAIRACMSKLIPYFSLQH